VTEGQVSDRLFVSHIPTADDLVSQQKLRSKSNHHETAGSDQHRYSDPHPTLFIFSYPRCVLAFFSCSLVFVVVIVAFLFPCFIVVVVVRLVRILDDNNLVTLENPVINTNIYYYPSI
jgi:hypothetical protein